MKKLFVLKIGGSVVTYKNRSGFSVRRNLLKKIAREILDAKKKIDFDLILVHGAGGLGHSLALEYNLKQGTKNNKNALYGALLSRIANQKLNLAITEILIGEGLSISPVHTASVIIQNNHEIQSFNMDTVKEALNKNCIPLLYGDMVFDKKLGMTICSGDAIVPYLANMLGANKIFFASDINGIFTQDPYIFPKAELIKKISINEIKKSSKVSNSHNVDVTGGLFGKIEKIDSFNLKIESAEIFNGLNASNFKKVFLDIDFPHTKIFFK